MTIIKLVGVTFQGNSILVFSGLREPTSKRSGVEGRGRSTCLPPRFDNPGYEPGRVEKQRCSDSSLEQYA